MSDKPHYCEQCNRECQCDAVTPYLEGREDMFAVAWRCPGCSKRVLIVSPVGPLGPPRRKTCLQCGHAVSGDDQPCGACGTVLSQVLSAEEQARSEPQLLRDAREAFAIGACRRGLTIVNLVLRRNRRSKEAWSIKSQFMEHLGFRQAHATVIRFSKRWWQFWA